MSDTAIRSSDVLVLGGGGVLGEAWMNALLAGLEESGRFDPRGFGLYLGTSAGSIVAAARVAGRSPFARRPRRGGRALRGALGRSAAGRSCPARERPPRDVRLAREPRS